MVYNIISLLWCAARKFPAESWRIIIIYIYESDGGWRPRGGGVRSSSRRRGKMDFDERELVNTLDDRARARMYTRYVGGGRGGTHARTAWRPPPYRWPADTQPVVVVIVRRVDHVFVRQHHTHTHIRLYTQNSVHDDVIFFSYTMQKRVS